MKGMNDLVRQAQIMQRKMAQMQEEMKTKTIEATSGGGMVTAVVNGGMDLVSIKIDKSVVDPEDVDMLQDLVFAAVSDAMKRAKEMNEQEMGQLTGGMKIPGLF
ncbi:YbaB/EbfC family nucleoid-associated protein [Desulfovibrio inopinatus]|uniref:YbaB/EbfC family nucleoid-associated protein n=1 Tax=Desulfovibrio inopinatus TaxID=102109 RepID=UPI00041EA06B|nr:YbaB/EbfC family nucleoid-associated protein [Desulfovibrio inopinatus]